MNLVSEYYPYFTNSTIIINILKQIIELNEITYYLIFTNRYKVLLEKVELFELCHTCDAGLPFLYYL